MGGHGGLNILPQKKWNVYNHDNRKIVDDDKKKHALKLRIQYEDLRAKTLKDKIGVLMEEHNEGQDQQMAFATKAQEKQKPSFVMQEPIGRDKQLTRHLREQEMMREHAIDESTRFCGNGLRNVPWYLTKKNQVKVRESVHAKDLVVVRKSDSYVTHEVAGFQSGNTARIYDRYDRRDTQRERTLDKQKEDGLTDLEKMRKKRLEREKKEQQRESKITKR